MVATVHIASATQEVSALPAGSEVSPLILQAHIDGQLLRLAEQREPDFNFRPKSSKCYAH
jgi:hypothetical protein